MFDILNTTTGTLDHTLLQYLTRYDENVLSNLQSEGDTGADHYDDNVQIRTGNENTKFVNNKVKILDRSSNENNRGF